MLMFVPIKFAHCKEKNSQFLLKEIFKPSTRPVLEQARKYTTEYVKVRLNNRRSALNEHV
jgi:hypothetical protein